MSHYYAIPLVDAAELAEAQRVIGPDFSRIVSYFQEDGVKAIVTIEQAMHARSAKAMALPAHKLKGEARQLGAVRLGEIAETIEKAARDCIEKQLPPEGIVIEVAMLRGCFAETLKQFAVPERALPHPGVRPGLGRPVFGRRTSLDG